ncbi:MAG: hypothetical protein H6736_01405 [Alphaproteobacteria bacterium]|nr:hypothetical protein [Alphaproteobacteria bacterium]MCB9690447.1 hypothetical protein [Alphaproteobacteria bacterium]
MAEDPEGLTVGELAVWVGPVVAGWIVSGLVLVGIIAAIVAALDGSPGRLWDPFVLQMFLAVTVPPAVFGVPWALVLRVTRRWPVSAAVFAGALFSCAMGAADGLFITLVANPADGKPFVPMALATVGGGGAVCFGVCAMLERIGRPRWPGVVMSLPVSAGLAVLALFVNV